MATKGNMTLRIEPELKKQAADLFQSLGMDLSTATGIFYRQALRYHGLPFEVRLDEPNETTYAAMKAAENDEDMHGPFDSVAEAPAGAARKQRETVAVGSSGNPPRERAKALSYCQPQRGGGVKVLLRYFLTRK